jgi:hypothetical protein
MDIVKKFRLALELNDMTYLSFARKYGLSKQAISLAVQALKHGFTFSARVEKIIIKYSNEQMRKLKKLLNSDKAA